VVVVQEEVTAVVSARMNAREQLLPQPPLPLQTKEMKRLGIHKVKHWDFLLVPDFS
jgi:hypothetical protein